MTPVLNEIRAFNDHVARCYLENADERFINTQLRRASRHITRIILDCYKYLNISFNNEIVKFEKKTKNVDLSIIDNGVFFVKYQQLRKNVIILVRDAKLKESLEGQNEISPLLEQPRFIKFLERLKDQFPLLERLLNL